MSGAVPQPPAFSSTSPTTSLTTLVTQSAFKRNSLRCKTEFFEIWDGEYADQPVCLKILIVQRSEAVLKEFKQELRVLSSLPPHECIVQLKAVCVDADCPCLIEEQGDMSLGELLFGGEMHIPLTMTAKLLVARKIMAGVAHLHAQNPPVLHRDLKADNVLVFFGDCEQLGLHPGAHSTAEPAFAVASAKLCDFGLARTRDVVGRMTAVKGTPCFVAPERLTMSSAESQYDERCDVFSVGMVLYELFFERRPGEALLEAAHAKDDARPGTVMMNMYIYEGKRPALNESAVLPSCVAAVDAGASAPASAVDASPPAALPQGAVAVSSSDAVAVAQNIINVGRRRSSGSDGGVAVGSGAAARIVALIARCWAQEPADRPTALEVLAELEAIERDHVA